jgi:hypothetical protein
MAFLDFMKNQQTQQQSAAQQTAQQKPETAREMYARQAAQDKQTLNSPAQMPADQQAKAAEIGARLQQATRHLEPEAPSSSPIGGNTSQPMAQKALNQDKVAPMLSPTTEQVGTRATEAPSEVKSHSQDQSAQRPTQTVARRPPSWER